MGAQLLDTPTTDAAHVWRWKLPLLLATAITLTSLVLLRAPWINGSWYWWWPWREPPPPGVRWYGWMLLAALPVVVAAVFEPWARSSRTRLILLGLLMIGVFTQKLMVQSVLTPSLSFDVLNASVQDPLATSYYTDAAVSVGQPDWLKMYPQVLPKLNLHTKSKPPGAVAYYRAFIFALGEGRLAAVAAGIVLAAVSALSVPATAWLVCEITADPAVATCAAVIMALCPGLVVVTPTFDACWPILTCALVVFWFRAVSRDDWRYAIAFGATFAVTCFATYNLLVLGAFLGAWTLFVVPARTSSAGPRIASAILLCLMAIGSTVAIYVVFWLVTGFNPIATFASAWRNQNALLERWHEARPYPWTILFDLLDFAFGAGWLAVPLALAGLVRISRAPRPPTVASRNLKTTVALALALPVLVAVLGLLQSETARVWNFMLPLLVLPAAIELSAWPARARTITYCCMLAILLVIARHLRFMGA